MRRLIGFWLLSLVVVVMLGAIATAQINRTPPHILSGDDIGFRIDGTDRSGKPTGTLLVRVNGQWVEVGSAIKAAPALTK